MKLKQALYKLFSTAMALLVLFSTVSFTVERHYCGDILIDSAVFTKVQKCNMEMSQQQSSGVKKGCCSDELEVVKGQDQLKLSKLEDFSIDQILFATAFAYTYVNVFEGLPKRIIPHKDYSPPNIIQDIQVLDQVFLI